MAQHTEETEYLLSKDTTSSVSVSTRGCHVYKRRWYCLCLYALLCFILGLISNTFGPIAHAAEIAFNWTDADIALLSNWQPLVFIFSIPLMAWVIDSKGLRVSCVLSALVMVVGCGIRCITSTPPTATWLYHTGQIVSSLASPVVFAAPSVFSNTWFPHTQRTIATGAATIGNGLGLALGFILGPLIVKVPPTPSADTNVTSTPQYDDDTIKIGQGQIMIVMYIQFSLSLMTFVLFLFYFPARPPSPPSLTAATERLGYLTGLKTIVRLPKFWLLAFVYAATNGIYSGLAAVLDIDLKATGVQQDQLVAGWLSFGSYMASVVGCLVISVLADYFTRWVKVFLIVICILATTVFTWFSLIIDGVLPSSVVTLSMTYVSGSVLLNAAVPVFYELACDATYPLGEGLTNGMINVVNNIAMVIFLFVLTIPNIGTSWMNWAMVASVAVCIPLLIPFKPAPERTSQRPE